MSLTARLFRHHWGHYLAAALFGAAAALAVLYQSSFTQLFSYYSALTTGGAVCVLLGLLWCVSYNGYFDIFGYAFSQFGTRRYEDLRTYSRIKMEKRSKQGWTFMPWITVGIIFIAAGLLFRVFA
ncbi:MAG: DUF3899 domain-containing protein [Clostridiales bacterium]|nr:DUF3899 domain-containing protein [Clostridiales bacterium]